MKRKVFTTLIDPDIWKWLKRKSKETGVKIYAILEEAIEDLKKKEKQDESK